MKTLRFCFVLLLALLLPLKGALAASLPCAGGAGVHSESRAGTHPGHAAATHQEVVQEGGHPSAAHAHAAPHGHAVPDGDAPGQAADTTCSLCTASCALTPLVTALPTLAEPPGLAAVQCCEHRAAAPHFLSGGLERPPRTC